MIEGPGIADLLTDWSYRSSPIAPRVRVKRWRHRLTGRQAAPSWRMIVPPVPAPRWNVLFLYAPSGDLDRDQGLILDRVRRLEGKMLVIMASSALSVPAPVSACADAVMVKDTGGFDFSAYRLALDAIAEHSPGALAYVQNDSVFGPFGDINRLIRQAPWDLTGFIGTRAVENHLSSFAFVLRDVTPARMTALRPVLSPSWSCDAFDAVILLQETRLARVAARTMSVGAYWFVPTQPAARSLPAVLLGRLTGTRRRVDASGDATLACPIPLLDAGFPFIKRSLFTKFAGLHDEAALRAALRSKGWAEAA